MKALYLLINHLVEREPIASFTGVQIHTLIKLLELANSVIKGDIYLNNHIRKEQYLFLREIRNILQVTTERAAWDYYRTLIQIVWLIQTKFEFEDPKNNNFSDYFVKPSNERELFSYN